MNVSGALSSLIGTLFDIYLWIVLTRFILQLARADFYNPISQFIVKATSPVLTPLRRIIPGFGGVDVASIVLFTALVAVKLALIVFVFSGNVAVPVVYMIKLLLLSMAKTVIYYFLFVILISAVLSWVSAAGGGYNPFADLLRQISEPVLAPARKIIPPMGGLDISPMLVMLLLGFIANLFGLSNIP